MKILITGGAGFIGSHLADRLLAEGHEVLVIDNYATGRRDNLAEREGLTIVEDTIEDSGAVDAAFQGFGPEVVVHAAASYKDPEAWGEDVRTNALGTANVVRAAQASGGQTGALLPDRPLLRHHARGAAGLAVAPDPARFELRDLQDRGRAVHRDVGARLRVAAAGQRLRAAQHLGPPAHVLPPADRGQGRVRDGHAARLHLRRRSHRRGHAGGGRGNRAWHLPRLLGLGLLDQGAFRRDDRGAAGGGARRGGGGSPQGRGRRLHDPARPLTHPRGLRLGAEDAAGGGRTQARSTTTARTASPRRTRT